MYVPFSNVIKVCHVRTMGVIMSLCQYRKVVHVNKIGLASAVRALGVSGIFAENLNLEIHSSDFIRVMCG
jgi:hypothetical protein